MYNTMTRDGTKRMAVMNGLKRLILIGLLGVVAFGPGLASKHETHPHKSCIVEDEPASAHRDIENLPWPVNRIIETSLVQIVWNTL
jgi:hypothetical protein